MNKNIQFDYDFIIIGSGFGGSVAALRLTEKGYKVLVIEKGKWYEQQDFPKSNWNIKKWLWIPFLKCYGFFKITFYRHVGVLSGVGVGGGSLVYANTLPVPKREFFSSGNWSGLADWENELREFYSIAKQMLGVAKNPRMEIGDKVLNEIAREINKTDGFEPADVGVFFGETNRTVKDPYFNGEGPDRSGCTFCGGCMIGCRENAKNTLDKNYLFLAQKKGAEILAEKEVFNVEPYEISKKTGYKVEWKSSTKWIKKKGNVTAGGIVFAGGVLGTVLLLLKLKNSSLPNLSDRVGEFVRTNSESLMGVVIPDSKYKFSDGIAISSILHTDEHSHLEPVRYPSGSGFWRLQMAPLTVGRNFFSRLSHAILEVIEHPVKYFRLFTVRNWAERTQILLFMRSINGTIKFKPGIFRMKSQRGEGELPTAFLPEAKEFASKFAEKVNGTPGALLSEIILGIPTTAHILGGAVMGASREHGVIDKENKIFGYDNMYVCDGSMISSNPGVNPSLTITAISERAMSKIPAKVI
ncbi:MAG: GMC family oxidoreductase [Melioribacteraceae bacterium]|nr:GMC family oxidoreductase [Melioribacteraceae bacterium]